MSLRSLARLSLVFHYRGNRWTLVRETVTSLDGATPEIRSVHWKSLAFRDSRPASSKRFFCRCIVNCNIGAASTSSIYTGPYYTFVAGARPARSRAYGRHHPCEFGRMGKIFFLLALPTGKVTSLQPVDFVIQVEGDGRALVDQASLMPADNIDGLDPDMVHMAKQMGTPLLRFGGNFTSGYHWRDGIGPRDKRVSMLNIAWGIPEYNTFGTDEFLHFCDLIGAQPQVALNLGSGTPDEASAWVRYVDQHWKQHSGLLWELGNELWGNWNLGYPTLDQLPGQTFSSARRFVLQILRPSDRDRTEDSSRFNKWNAAQLTNPPKTFDYL